MNKFIYVILLISGVLFLFNCNLEKIEENTIGNTIPTAGISVQTGKIFEDCPVNFTSISTGASIYSWDFGDGTNKVSNSNPSHIYNSPGVYNVSLVVSNGTKTDEKSIQVTVYQANIFTKSFGSYPEETGCCAAPTNDGGYLLVGNSRPQNEDYDIYIIKIDANGNQTQNPIYIDYGSHDYVEDLVPTSDGGFAICGYTQSFGVNSPAALLIKLDGSGNEIWHNHYTGEYIKAKSVVQGADGGFYLTGSRIRITGLSDHDVLILKTNMKGDESWRKYYGRGEYDEGMAILLNSDNSLMIVGHTDSLGSQDPFLIKIDQDGGTIWEKPIPIGSDNDWAEDIESSGDGGYLIAGFTGSIGAGGEDGLLIKVDNNGNVINSDNTYGGLFNDRIYSIAALGNGQFALTGYKQQDSGGKTDMYAFRVNANGQLVGTEKTFGNLSQFELGNVVIPGNDNGLLILGNVSLGTGDYNFYVVKTGCE